jgi:hypothetical protein
VMQGNGDESVHGTRGDARIGEGFCEPSCERGAEVEGFVVFKIVNAFADDASAFIWRDCAQKVDFAVCAIGASERIGNRAIERVRASLALRRDDVLRRFRAFRANVDAPLRIRATSRAMGREAERASGAPQTS